MIRPIFRGNIRLLYFSSIYYPVLNMSFLIFYTYMIILLVIHLGTLIIKSFNISSKTNITIFVVNPFSIWPRSRFRAKIVFIYTYIKSLLPDILFFLLLPHFLFHRIKIVLNINILSNFTFFCISLTFRFASSGDHYEHYNVFWRFMLS